MSFILERINSPADLTQLSISEMEQLAGELRRLIVDTVAENGGHLASSLGAVELTLALYKVFRLPQDKVVWDVGHNSPGGKVGEGPADGKNIEALECSQPWSRRVVRFTCIFM